MAIQTVKTGAAVNDGTGDDARTAFTKINQNFTNSAHAASRLVGEAAGNVMEVGAFGVGSSIPPDYSKVTSNKGFFKVSPAITDDFTHEFAGGLYIQFNAVEGVHLFAPVTLNKPPYYRKVRNVTGGGLEYSTKHIFYTTENTSVDSNGFIKRASPIVCLFADKIELNDEAKLQPIALEKLGVGDYLIKGSTGFAQEGWYIETPKDANGNALVAVVYEQLANNDISVKTYDYMLNKKGRIAPDLETPLDIPATRWIDIRLQELPQTDVNPADETVATNAE